MANIVENSTINIFLRYFFEYVSIALPFYISSSFQLASASLMYFLFKDIKPPEEES